MTWPMIFLASVERFLRSVPWQVWAVIGLLIAGWYGANYAYDRGYEASEAKWDLAVAEERARQEAVNAEALREAERQLARLNAQRAALSAEIERLIEDANSDPDADRIAISVDSVRRLKAIGSGTGPVTPAR